MMASFINDELFNPFRFDRFDAGNENGSYFVRFRHQIREKRRIDNARIGQEIQPIHGFFQFLQGALGFADHFGVRAAPLAFPQMRADRCSRPQ
jgi:hypothetical protein